MSNSDWMERLQVQDGAEGAACKASELQDLLHSIVAQISDADRRHSDTLSQMQDRISLLGSEARSIRARVPDQFQTAFERIEAGMSELAARIAEVAQPRPLSFEDEQSQSPTKFAAADDTQMQSSAPVQSTGVSAMTQASEAPMPLRSALDPQATKKRRDEEHSRAAAGIDTFDVIESIPGDVADPWDRDAAEALAGIYDTHDHAFVADAGTRYPEPAAQAALTETAPTVSQPANSGISAEHAWFDQRFTDISKGIEQAIADIRPDQSFFALGQRLDQFERQFGQAFEALATRQDVEAVRLIEAHMAELVDHLEGTVTQLSRLDSLESQIMSISSKLDEVQQAAFGIAAPERVAAAPDPVDVSAIAKAAAQEAALHFSSYQQTDTSNDAIVEMRTLFDRTLSEVRQGDENTVALLDTLQQAMIRLLDRVDAIELNQHTSAQYRAQDLPREPLDGAAAAFGQERRAGSMELDNAVTSVAGGKAGVSQFNNEPELDRRNEPAFSGPVEPHERVSTVSREMRARSPDQLRQDFIAEARRAKMRLAAEEDEGHATASRTELNAEAPAVAKSAPGPAAKVTKADKDNNAAAKGSSIVTPRLIAVSLALLVAGVGGTWYFLQGKAKRTMAAAPAKIEQTAKAAEDDADVLVAPGQKTAGGQNDAGTAAPPPDANFNAPAAKQPELNLHSTMGQIVPGDADSVPLQGISVATDSKITVADIEKARRQHALASVSTKLGAAAADSMMAATATALSPDAADSATNTTPSGLSHAGKGALELPPATVGPLSLRLAAAQGDPSAEFEVGARLAEGKGTDQNFREAAKWYQRSASKGFAQAQYRLGTLHERGLGMKADVARAEEWYKRAAEQGNIKAMHNLAVLSANNRGGSPDYPAAAEWFTQAAERGLADSQFNLAVLHENGLGVHEDLKLAYKWLSLAARGGDKEAVRRRDILKGKLTAEELSAAEKMVSTFKAKPWDKMANDARAAGEAWKNNPANQEPG